MMLYMIVLSFNSFDSNLIEIRSGKHRTILPFVLPFPLTNVKEADLLIMSDMRRHPYNTVQMPNGDNIRVRGNV